MSDNEEFIQKQREVAQTMGRRFIELREIAADERFFIKEGIELVKDIFQAGFDNGERAGYNQGYHAAMKEVMDRLGKKIEELK